MPKEELEGIEVANEEHSATPKDVKDRYDEVAANEQLEDYDRQIAQLTKSREQLKDEAAQRRIKNRELSEKNTLLEEANTKLSSRLEALEGKFKELADQATKAELKSIQTQYNLSDDLMKLASKAGSLDEVKSSAELLASRVPPQDERFYSSSGESANGTHEYGNKSIFEIDLN